MNESLEEIPVFSNDENNDFFVKEDRALRKLFESAKAANEIDFAFALEPEERGFHDAGWSNAGETFVAFDDYTNFLNSDDHTRIRVRIAFSFYCHLSEASGFYEVPKKMLFVSEGNPYFRKAFKEIEEIHRQTGNRMAPNANAVFRDLVGHSKNLGFDELSEVFADAFDPQIRNAYTHSNYILTQEEIRIKDKATNKIRIIPWSEFHLIFNRGIGFFQILRDVVKDYMRSYHPAKFVMGKLHDEPVTPIKIEFHPVHYALVISRFDDYWRWAIDAREIFADEILKKDDS
jgi:hypothetical protein